MKDYLATVSVSWNVGLNAESEEEAIKAIKEIFVDEYNIELKDNEISIISEISIVEKA